MEREKQIKLFRVFVTVALVVSLIMNFTLFSKMGHLENQLNSISDIQYSINDNVNGQTSHIQSVLDDMRKEQSWISPITMDVNPNDFEDGDAEATFEWQVKELQKDSEVVFHYAYGDREDFTTLPAKELQQGLFQVIVPLNVDMTPIWDVHLMNQKGSGSEKNSKKEMEEQMAQDRLKYYVTVSYGDMVKSSEVHNEHVGQIGSSQYGTLQTDIVMYDKLFMVMLMNHHMENSSITLEEANLLKYEGDKLLGKETFEVDEQHDPHDPYMDAFKVDQVKQYDDMRLVVQVVFSNGETFEKEVY
ncbi:hypothetical protein [Bacillus sp. Marseille-Q3570]|uniref:hypothetical protein n=1 Tax=Bacillus sp. Marseille-Q3570 TaxID=2963522 RepID=UPI0021B7E389|nr:hypothetical protein [Bacillus sp. Marseille-Q3570]